LLLIWGNAALAPRKRQLFESVISGQVSFPLKLGEECTGGCTAQLFVWTGAFKAAPVLKVPQPLSQVKNI